MCFCRINFCLGIWAFLSLGKPKLSLLESIFMLFLPVAAKFWRCAPFGGEANGLFFLEPNFSFSVPGSALSRQKSCFFMPWNKCWCFLCLLGPNSALEAKLLFFYVLEAKFCLFQGHFGCLCLLELNFVRFACSFWSHFVCAFCLLFKGCNLKPKDLSAPLLGFQKSSSLFWAFLTSSQPFLSRLFWVLFPAFSGPGSGLFIEVEQIPFQDASGPFIFFDILGRISGFNLFKPACWAPSFNLLKPPCGLLASIYLSLFVAFFG